MAMKLGLNQSCSNCQLPFSSIFSFMLKGATGRRIANTFELCPRCRAICRLPDGRLVPFRDQLRFLPDSATVTYSRLPLRPAVRELTFSVGNLLPRSFTWKVARERDEIYVFCREMPEWKISLHKSGRDHIGYTHQSGKKVAGGARSRHFHTGTRLLPFYACVHRVASIVIHAPFDKMFSRYALPLTDIVLISPNLQKVVVDIYYSEEHPDKFAENRMPESQLIGVIEGHSDEFISVSLPNHFLRRPENIKHGENVRADFTQRGANDASFTFGVSDKNVYMINVTHP